MIIISLFPLLLQDPFYSRKMEGKIERNQKYKYSEERKKEDEHFKTWTLGGTKL